MITVNAKLNVGIEQDGVFHTDFTMRQSTIADAINAIEKAGDDPSNLRLRIFKAAEQIEHIGAVTEIDGELLMGLSDEDIEPIFEAQDELVKKLKGLSKDSGPIENSKSSCEDTDSKNPEPSPNPLPEASSTSSAADEFFKGLNEMVDSIKKPT